MKNDGIELIVRNMSQRIIMKRQGYMTDDTEIKIACLETIALLLAQIAKRMPEPKDP